MDTVQHLATIHGDAAVRTAALEVNGFPAPWITTFAEAKRVERRLRAMNEN